MSLSVAVRPMPDETVNVEAVGEVDLLTATELEQAIALALATPGATGVVVDLAGVTFLDSSGISALLKGRRLAEGATKTYRVGAAHGFVLQILELTGVWQFLSGE